MYTPYELEKHMQHRNEELEQRMAKLRLIQESRVTARRAAQLRGRASQVIVRHETPVCLPPRIDMHLSDSSCI